jgi:hypothetical protein
LSNYSLGIKKELPKEKRKEKEKEKEKYQKKSGFVKR